MKLFIIILAFSFSNAFASETDNFTPRLMNMENSKTWLNAKMNEILIKVESESTTCQTEELDKSFYNQFGGMFYLGLKKWPTMNPNGLTISLEQSIYQDIANETGDDSYHRLVKFKHYYGSGIFKYNDIYFGGDKLTHFLQIGYTMYFAVNKTLNPNFKDIRNPFQIGLEILSSEYNFIKNLKTKNPVEIVAQVANFEEDSSWGMESTLVKSYGDMAADLSGYQFWSDLTSSKKPFYKCIDGKFKLVRIFNWSDYITTAWDEAINCSTFHHKIEQRVKDQIEKRNVGSCPINLLECKKLKKSYGVYAKDFLHPFCNR